MKKRAEVAEMFNKIQTMGGGDIDKIERTMAKKLGMKPIDRSSIGKKSKARPASAQPRRRRMKKSATVAPSPGGNITPSTISGAHRRVPSSTTGALVGGSARKARNTPASGRKQRVRPSSALPSRRNTRGVSARTKKKRPGSAALKRKGGGRGPRRSDNENPELAIEGLRARQNEQLLRVLEQEQEAEERRERILRGITVSCCVRPPEFLVRLEVSSLFFVLSWYSHPLSCDCYVCACVFFPSGRGGATASRQSVWA